MFGEPSDGATFPCRIPSFDQYGNSLAAALNPPLQPDHFHLQAFEFFFIEGLPHCFKIDVLLLEKLNESSARIDPLKILFRKTPTAFADQGQSSRLPIPVAF